MVRYLWSITETWALVALLPGLSVVAEVPVIIPLPTAHSIAGLA